MKIKFDNEKGVALVITLGFSVVLYMLASVFLLATVNEKQMVQREQEMLQAFYVANGAAQAGLKQIDVLINDFLLNTIASANPSGVITFAASKVASGKGIEWLVYAVRDENVPVLAENGDQAEFGDTGVIGSHAYQYQIFITEKSDPLAVGSDAWDFPYNYQVVGSSTVGSVQQTVRITGDFTVRLQKDNFAKFALFTNEQTTASGTNVWFTNATNFAGPVHTNGRFNFALNPSGTFEEAVSQHEERARFYNSGWTVLLDADANGSSDVPVFHNGFERDQDTVTLNSPTEQQDMIDQATGGQAFVAPGIYLPNDGTSLTGGIYVNGSGNVTMGVDGSNNPVYTITHTSGSTKTITVNQTTQQTTVADSGVGTQVTYAGLPTGTDKAGTLIFVDGAIHNLGGTVQADSTLTVSSKDDIVINDHIRYENHSAGSGTPGSLGYIPPSAADAVNLLGIVTWEGDVRVGTSAPDDVEIHGTILASNGVFQVDNYNSGDPRGVATLFGGVISDNYGAFGQFNGSTGQQQSGYGRNFVYDQRMQAGQSPPYFPSLNTFIAFTNDITDKMVWQEGE